ncbi:hypothetical protein CC79DRAFT_1113302 [Sarocladium strictum]
MTDLSALCELLSSTRQAPSLLSPDVSCCCPAEVSIAPPPPTITTAVHHQNGQHRSKAPPPQQVHCDSHEDGTACTTTTLIRTSSSTPANDRSSVPAFRTLPPRSASTRPSSCAWNLCSCARAPFIDTHEHLALGTFPIEGTRLA